MTTRILKVSSLLLVLTAACATVIPCFGEDWPGFRGPTGQGVSQEKNLPLTWGLHENLAWRTEIPGTGWSSPIVWDGRVFVTATNAEGASCHLVCLDAETGHIAWDKELFRQPASRKLKENSHATPTSVTDGKLVYAAFNGGRIVAVDFNGNVVWNWRDDKFISKHGLAASPILYHDSLIMAFDGNGPSDVDNIGFRTAWDGAFLVALDKRTGREKWRGKRDLSRQAHVTPMIVEVNGRSQLISGAGDVVQGFDPDSGKCLWTVRSSGEGVVPAIVYGDGLVFTSSGYGAPTVRAIRPDGHDDATETHIAWESKANVPLMPSFVYADGLLFCLKESGVISCLDARTGKVIWKERLDGTYGASPVLAEGRLYCLAEDGSTTVLAAAKTFKQLAKNPLEGPSNASPAISNGRIFIRSEKTLFCVRSLAAADAAPAQSKTKDLPKKLYAHYMPCYPVAAMATAYHRANDAHKIRHNGTGQFDAIGDRWRNWPLVPDGMTLTPVQSADLEIRRALRGGVDGFLFDAWAGGENGRKVFDALFEAAEAKDYPFEISICLDPSCLEGDDKVQAAADAIRQVLEKHGKSPKLARRDGKPLVAGYNSIFIGLGYAERTLGSTPRWKGGKDLWKDPEFRTDPSVWQAFGQAYREIEKRVGQPIYFHVCMDAFFWMVDNSKWNPKMLADGAGVMASNVGAVGGFLGSGRADASMAAAVRAKGAEWAEPMYYQYENIGWGGNRISMGFDILRDRWKAARENGSTIIQFITWNDYTENTCLAPAYDTRYTILDLNAYFVQWWKTGREPVVEHDRVYLSYRKYPKGAKIFPFKPKQPDAGGVLEVLTLLPRPAKVRLPGRGAEFDAPAGMSWRQFELKPGPVIAEIVRGGTVDLRLESPEPITDRPYREQNGMTCFSSEFLRHWQADFGDAKPLVRGEYADDDNDGLPNWFEMYWFGKFLDWSTATGADAKAIGKDGKTNLQHYLDQTAPVDRPAVAK